MKLLKVGGGDSVKKVQVSALRTSRMPPHRNRRDRNDFLWRWTRTRVRIVSPPKRLTRWMERGNVKIVALPPTATNITVREVLAKFDTDFATMAQAVENGEFALWVGSGISRRAPNLGRLIERAFDYIRERAVTPAKSAAYMPALEEALGLAEVDPATVQARFGEPLAAWPEHDAIIGRLWNQYSRVLDIRIAGEDSDFVLWEAINIQEAFAHPAASAAEHLCIAILILEGAVQAVASANWDGFIEAATARLSNGIAGVMQVVVDPNQLRGPVGRAKLLKFHGCIVHAEREPLVFRRYLTGSYTQIMSWPETAANAAMRNEIVGLATNQKTLVLGLSIQDNNLQTIFARAKEVHAWPWPCAPDAPGHVFCEDKIKPGQRDVLRLAYGAAYDTDPDAVHSGTLLRAWGEQVLIALVLKLLADKLVRMMALTLTGPGQATIAAGLEPSLMALRDVAADLALPDVANPDPELRNRTPFVDAAIAVWSRMLAVFRSGALPQTPDSYESLSSSTPNLLAADPNVQASGLGRLGIALSLLQHGCSDGHWHLSSPASNDLTSGAMTACATRPGAMGRPLFIVRSVTEAIALQNSGAFANDNAVVVHGDDLWHRMVAGGGSARRMRAAPGRTGHVGDTHISLGDIIAQSADVATLQQHFITEMML